MQTAYRSSNIRRARPACKPSACDGCRAENGSCSPTEAAPARAWTPNTCSCYPVLPATVETLVKDQDNSGLPSNLWVSSFHPSAKTTSISLLLSFSLLLLPPLPLLLFHILSTWIIRNVYVTRWRHAPTLLQLSRAAYGGKFQRIAPDDDSSVVQRVPLAVTRSDTLPVSCVSASNLSRKRGRRRRQDGDVCETNRRDREEGGTSFSTSWIPRALWRATTFQRCVCDVTPIEKAIIGACQRVCGKVGPLLPRSTWHSVKASPRRPRDDIYIAGKMRFCTSAHTGTYHRLTVDIQSQGGHRVPPHQTVGGLRTNFIPHSTTLGMTREGGRVGRRVAELGIDVDGGDPLDHRDADRSRKTCI